MRDRSVRRVIKRLMQGGHVTVIAQTHSSNT